MVWGVSRRAHKWHFYEPSKEYWPSHRLPKLPPYVIGPIIGTTLGAYFYELIRCGKKKKMMQKGVINIEEKKILVLGTLQQYNYPGSRLGALNPLME